MPPGTGTEQMENPVCITDSDLPPPPSIGGAIDPAEPHPDEPGAPDDCPEAQPLRGPD